MGASLNCAQPRQKEGARPKGPASHDSHLLRLTPEVRARILWLLAGEYGDFVCLQPVTNLLGTCYEMRMDNQSCFWRCKVDFLLKAAGNFQLQMPMKCDQDTCVLLLTVIRLLKNALNCDWLALHDLHVVLFSTGLARPWNMVLLLYSLLSSQSSLVMSQQALHWLWDIVTGFSKPWLISKEPLEAKSLESLRAWLRKFVSNDIFTWQDLTDEALYQGVASTNSQVHRQRKERVVKVALWLILVHEFGAQEEVQPSRIAACVKAAATAGHKLKQLWAVPLLFLAAPLRHGCLEMMTPGGWNGVVLLRSATEEPQFTSGGLSRVTFTQWSMDASWLHSQRGEMRSSSAGKPSRWVQLDARFDPASGTYLGTWVEETLEQPLDVLVFSLNRCDANFKALVCRTTSSQAYSELFGLAGGLADGQMMLRCFYLTKPREAADAAWM